MGFWEPRHPGCQPEALEESRRVRSLAGPISLSCSILDDQGKLLDLDQTDWLEFYIVLVRESDRESRQP